MIELVIYIIIPILLAFGGFYLIRWSLKSGPKGEIPPENLQALEKEKPRQKIKRELKEFHDFDWEGELLLHFIRNPVRGEYNDECLVICEDTIESFPCNVDPSGSRPGHGFGAHKGMGTIKRGFYKESHCLGKHKKVYPALVQCNDLKILRDADDQAENVVEIDGKRYYQEINRFGGFNIHPGGRSTTGSEGCLTFHPDYWQKFIDLTLKQMKRKQVKAVDILIS